MIINLPYKLMVTSRASVETRLSEFSPGDFIAVGYPKTYILYKVSVHTAKNKPEERSLSYVREVYLWEK